MGYMEQLSIAEAHKLSEEITRELATPGVDKEGAPHLARLQRKLLELLANKKVPPPAYV
jgi:hypothetical protein